MKQGVGEHLVVVADEAGSGEAQHASSAHGGDLVLELVEEGDGKGVPRPAAETHLNESES